MVFTLLERGPSRIIKSTRGGFVTRHPRHPEIGPEYGNLFEEGFAERFRGEYMKKYIPPHVYSSLVATLEFGPLDLEATIPFYNNTHPGFPFPMPLKYMFFTPSGEPSFGTSQLAGAVFDILCRNIPDLWDVVVKARTDPYFLKQIPKMIDSIGGGLYGELLKTPYNYQDFLKALRTVIEAVGGHQQAVVANSPALNRKWQQLIRLDATI